MLRTFHSLARYSGTMSCPAVSSKASRGSKTSRSSASMASSKSSKSYGPPKIAVILAGCGVQDGTEVHEAAAVLSHIERNGATLHCFAPNINQMHVIDHGKGTEDGSGCRNVLSESARLARGSICPLSALAPNHSYFQAVIVPGGFGVAKNLSDFAVKGPKMEVQKDVSKALLAFHENKKPIGLCCIAPVLAAKLIPCVTITLGKSCGDKWPFKDAILAAKKMGANIEEKGVLDFTFDPKNNVYSTPAFMYDGRYDEIDDGIGNMVRGILNGI